MDKENNTFCYNQIVCMQSDAQDENKGMKRELKN